MIRDLTHRVIAARHVVGDQVVLDAIEIARLAQPIPVRARGHGVRIAWLRDAWQCTQPTVSRRLAAINAAPPELGLGRLERVRYTRGWWRLLEVQA